MKNIDNIHAQISRRTILCHGVKLALATSTLGLPLAGCGGGQDGQSYDKDYQLPKPTFSRVIHRTLQQVGTTTTTVAGKFGVYRTLELFEADGTVISYFTDSPVSSGNLIEIGIQRPGEGIVYFDFRDDWTLSRVTDKASGYQLRLTQFTGTSPYMFSDGVTVYYHDLLVSLVNPQGVYILQSYWTRRGDIKADKWEVIHKNNIDIPGRGREIHAALPADGPSSEGEKLHGDDYTYTSAPTSPSGYAENGRDILQKLVNGLHGSEMPTLNWLASLPQAARYGTGLGLALFGLGLAPLEVAAGVAIMGVAIGANLAAAWRTAEYSQEKLTYYSESALGLYPDPPSVP